jgi:hypothetical protein
MIVVERSHKLRNILMTGFSQARRVSAAVAFTFMSTMSCSMSRADPITAKSGGVELADFDIVQTEITASSDMITFRMSVSGKAGASKPAATGKLAGSTVYSYVWPTSLNSAAVGFEKDQGILAFAATSHPDFDDTPEGDENGDGDKKNDGDVWHSHWVVLVKDEACGAGGLKVQDIANGGKPALPKTWPGLPLLIDSPGYAPSINGDQIEVSVPAAALGDISGMTFDGVTSGLRVNESAHAPLLCVATVFDVASGDLSLPGKISK